MNKVNKIKTNYTTWFKLIALLLPFVFLVFIELLLRSFNVGHDLSLFIEHPENSEYLILNPNVSRRYFTSEKNSTRGYVEPFKKEKKPGTFRIFVQGGSTAYGFPYENNGSFHRMLQYQLNQNLPEKDIELINLSLTAVNSYTLLDFSDEIISQQPDAVLIYAGHNEYYGALGVGSTSKLGSNTTFVNLAIQFRKLRLGQMLNRVIAGIKPKDSPDLSETLMKRMVDNQSIEKDSRLYEKGLEQFEENIAALLSKYEDENILVYMGTLVSNLKDQPPFASDLSSEDNAIFYYQLAQEAEKQNNYEKAREYYVWAKENDLLRFRAPEKINQTIRELSDKYHTNLVDIEAEFEQHSTNRIIGQELMLEHLHPNLKGYYHLSMAFYNSLLSNTELKNKKETTHFTAFNELPLTEMDSLFGAYTNLILRSQWPFNEPMPDIDVTGKSMPEVLAGGLAVKNITWDSAMSKLLQYHLEEKNYKQALKVAESLALAYPENFKSLFQAAKFAFNLEDYKKAQTYYYEAFKTNPNIELLAQVVKSAINARDFDFALFVLGSENASNLNSSMVAKMKSDIEKLEFLESEKLKFEDQFGVCRSLAKLYFDFGVYSFAKENAEKVLEIDSGNEFAKQIIVRTKDK